MSREHQILELIRSALDRFSSELSGYSVCLFGSRATRQHKDRSDFDLGVNGAKPIPLKLFYKIADALDELPTLYRIDWVDLTRADTAFRKHALKRTLVLYG